MDGMDDGLGDDVAPIDPIEGAHLQSKESEYSLKPENCNMLESQEMAVRGENDSPESSFGILADILEGKNVNRYMNTEDASEHPCTSPRTMDDAGVMVEELTVKNYDSSNLAIVGTSNNREKIHSRQNQWQHLYQLVGASGSGSSHGDMENNRAMPSVWRDVGYTSFPEFLAQKPLNTNRNEEMEHIMRGENSGVSSSVVSHGGIRTKILSKSGFSEFFVKTALKGKGIICKGPPHDAFRANDGDQNNVNAVAGPLVGSNASVQETSGPVLASHVSLSLGTKNGQPSSSAIAASRSSSEHEGVSLREWIKTERHGVSKAECLCIFKQIVDTVDDFHSQGVPLCDLRPSCFKLLQANQVKYVGSGVQRELSDNVTGKEISHSENHLIRRRPVEQGVSHSIGLCAKKQKFNENRNFRRWPLFSGSGIIIGTTNDTNGSIAGKQHSGNEYLEHYSNSDNELVRKSGTGHVSHTSLELLTLATEQLEEKWYASPEELNGGISTISSNVYSLGVLLFELLSHFDSEREHAAAMSKIRDRILPRKFLSENLKEAGFCFWLLHPEPSLRPTTREILQSEVINGFQDVFAEELSSLLDQDDADSELLLHFLISLKEQKQKDASKLVEDLRCIGSDIKEVERRHKSCLLSDSVTVTASRYLNKEPMTSEALSHLSPISSAYETRLMRNIHQLESVYFSMRSKINLPEKDGMIRSDRDLLRNRNKCYSAEEDEEVQTDPVGAFFDGLCKYARYSKFEVHGVLRSGEFNNSANVICSLSFDRDEGYFAAAGVSKKIKIFDFNAIFNDSVDIHYPVVEMANGSKFSCACWNNYIKNYLASSDYDGTVKLWDVSTGQTVTQYNEHEKRAWSVDFSQVYPTKLASGSDDCSVKLWNINERNCIGTIRNIANICCVQFSAHSTHLLAFGSADYRTYCYDLRNMRVPWCILAGHGKAVSYVKFLDHKTLVTASTDNTLKIWDLHKTSYSGLSTKASSLTLSGHTNEKNFVGLSIADGYIACGSETNEVYAYHRTLSMPITSYKFGSIDPISGKETDEDNGLFVSSVCWRGKSDMVVAANSSGCIKVLQLV